MRKNSVWVIATLMLAMLLSGCGEAEKADIVLFNGKIYTVDEEFTVAEAVAIKGDKIIAIGSNEDLVSYIENAKDQINLEGKTVLPGLIDAHAHLLGYAANLDQLNVVGTTSAEEVAQIVAQKAEELGPDAWVTGRGWDQNDWEVKEFPTREMLDAVVPNNPVVLRRVDGHASWCNSKALEIAGLTAETQAPDGGEIILDAGGNPTGVLIDRAMGIVNQHIPSTPPERLQLLLRAAVRTLLASGMTGMHDMGGGPSGIEQIKTAIDAGAFPFRVYFTYSANLENLDELLAAGRIEHGNHQLMVRSVKAYADGALGSRGAAMLEPYSDRADSTGLLITATDALADLTKRCLEAGFQVCTHAIGDRGNRAAIDAYERALQETGAKDARLRVEHAQIVAPEDIPRFAALGILPSMQPTHCTSDLPWAIDRVGDERIKGAYAWRSFLNTGTTIPCGSDFPVELTNPFHGLYSAISRKHQDGMPEEGYFPEEKMTREEALRGFTIWAAHAGFMEDIVGSLEVGKLADLIVIDRDYMAVPEEEIFAIKALMTMVGGEFVHMGGGR